MKVALVSLDQVWEDKRTNLQDCEKYINKASEDDVELIIFPEMTLTGFSMNIDNIAEVENSSPSIQFIKNLAKQYCIAIVFGLVIRESEKASNRLYFIDNLGNILDFYKKIHPFSFANEDRYYIGGDKIKSVVYKGVKFGLSICYDLRFPEFYSILSNESDVIINISNWPKKRVEHWNILLKARAIENQLYTIGVNRVGIDGNGLEYIESSKVYDANGDELISSNIFGNMKIYKIDKQFTQKFKETFNSVQDRKINLYKKWNLVS